MQNTLSGTLSLAEHLAAQRLHRSRLNRKMLLVLLIMLIAGVVLLSQPWAPRLAPLLMGGAVGGLIGMAATQWLVLPRRVARIHRQLKALAEPSTTRWDAVHLEAHSSMGHATVKWADFVRFTENEHLMLLYVADNLFYIFPKHWFSDPAQLEGFRQLATQAGKGG